MERTSPTCWLYCSSPSQMPLFSFPIAQTVKNLLAMQETWVQSLGQEDPLEREMAIHSSTLAWRIPWTEEPTVDGATKSQTPLSDEHTHCSSPVTNAALQLVVKGGSPFTKTNIVPWDAASLVHDAQWPPLSLSDPGPGSVPRFSGS